MTEKEMARKDRTLKFFEILMSVAAIVTAITALYVSVDQGRQTREHNKLSVMPSLNIDTDVTEGSAFNGISISNQGLGPAKIMLVRLYVDGQPVGDATQTDWSKVLEKLGLSEKEVHFRWLYGRTVLTADQSLKMLGADNPNPQQKEKIDEALKRLGMIVCYCSFYGDCNSSSYGNVPDNPCP